MNPQQKALEAIAEPINCSCGTCRGKCMTQEALRAKIADLQSIARGALSCTASLDILLLPISLTTFPERDDNKLWLQITQITLRNVRGLVANGQSESAAELITHYWNRWANAPTINSERSPSCQK